MLKLTIQDTRSILLLLACVVRLTSPSVIETEKTSGTITSYNYPGVYQPNSNDTVIVRVDHLRQFTITVSNISIEYSGRCKDDYLILYKNTTTRSDNILLGPLCGNHNECRNEYGCQCPANRNTSTVTVSVLSLGFMTRFISDESIEFTGYVLRYTSSQATSSMICKYMIRKNTTGITLTPSLLPIHHSYPLNINCEWNLQEYFSDEKYMVVINVAYFTIEYSGTSCVKDRLEILRIHKNSNLTKTHGHFFPPLILCGSLNSFSKSINNIEHGLFVTFMSDGSFNEGGFNINIYRQIYSNATSPKSTEVIRHQINITDDLKHTLSLNNISQEKPCSNKVCEHHITFVTDHGFQIILEHVTLRTLVIRVFDGPTTEFKEIINDRHVITSDGFYLTISFHNSDLTDKNYNVLYSHLNAFTSVKRLMYSCILYGTLNGQLSLNSVSKISLDSTKADVRIGVIMNQACYHTITVPKGYGISINIEKIYFSHSHSSNKCEIQGVVIYDDSFKSNNKLGPFCEVEKGYLKALFSPLVTSSSRAYIMLYNYVKSGEVRIIQLTVTLTANKCKGLHITPKNEKRVVTNYLKLEDHAETSLLQISVNVRKIKQKHECLSVVFHSRFYQMQHQFEFIEIGDTEISLCEFFGTSMIHGIHVDSKCSTVNNKCCLNVKTWALRTNKTIRVRNTSMSTPPWTVAFMKLIVGTTDQNPATLIQTCMSNKTIFGSDTFRWEDKIKKIRDEFNQMNTNMFPGQIDLKERNPTNCYITLITNHQQEMYFLEAQHYIELIIEGIGNYNQHVEIQEINTLKKSRRREMDREMYIVQDKTIYSHKISQLTYHSVSHELLTINLVYHGSDLIPTLMLYQLKPYKNIPIITKRPDHDDRYHALPEVSYANYTYFIAGCYDYRTKCTFSYLQKSCRARSGTLFSATTHEKLQAIKTTFSTRWKQIYILQKETFTGTTFTDIVIGLHKIQQVDGTYQWRWEDGSPLTISDWYYPDHTDHYIPNTVTNQVQKTIQPIEGENHRCVAMRMFHPRRSTNWFTVNCDNIIKNTRYAFDSICEIPDDTLKEKKSSIKTILHQTKTNILTDRDGYTGTRTYKYRQLDINVTCPKNWTFIRGKCWLLLQGRQSEYDFVEAAEECSQYGGEVADISDLYTVKQYLITIRYVEQYGSIWIQENGEASCLQYDLKGNVLQDDIDRLMLQKERYCITNILKKYTTNYPHGCKLTNIGRSYWQLFCHPQNVFCTRGITDIQKTCMTGYLRCDDDSCVSPDLICDGLSDCISGEDEMDCNIDDYFYECHRIGEKIPISKYCDYHKDCSDGSDEELCEFTRCLDGQFRCENGQCVDSTTRCNGRKDGCIDHSDEKWCNTQDNCTGFRCRNGRCIDKAKQNNARTDCDDSSDEPHLRMSLEVNTTMAKCLPVEGRCSERNFGCFNKGDMCVLAYDSDGIMKGCPNGAHLINCSTFQCPGRYKCLESYCIDMKRVCNDVVDCRFGEDEAECDDKECPGLYRCGHNQTFCLDKSHICNGDFDCTHHHSDEKYCDLPVCPKGCVCRGYHYKCEGTNITAIRSNISSLARALDLAQNHAADYIIKNYTFSRFSFLAYLRLRHADINQINKDTFVGLKNLIILDLRYNSITNLGQYAFKDLVNLRELLLEGNTLQTLLSHTFYGLYKLPTLKISNLGIREIKSGALNGLKSVKKLDLSMNRIDIIESGVFDVSYIFDKVVLTGNPLEKVKINVFKDITSVTVETSAFRFCCYTNYQSNCTPSIEAYSSCDDLMSNRFLQIIIWVIGGLSLVGNLAVIICRLILGMKGPPELCIFALSLSDLLTGIYLIIIATVDTMNRGEYMIHEMEWKTSVLCRFAGVISTLSAQLSSLLLLVITLDRFVHLVFPMAVVSYGRKSTIIACFVMFLFSTMTSVVPLLIPSYFGENFYGKTSLCLAYDFTEGKSPGWEYTLVTFILINLLNCIITVVCYLIIYISVRRSARRCDPTCPEDVALAKTLFILVLTDLICWFPLIITSLSVLNGHKVSRDMAAMLAVVILPINAAINPYLYTISSIQKARSRARHAAVITRNTAPS